MSRRSSKTGLLVGIGAVAASLIAAASVAVALPAGAQTSSSHPAVSQPQIAVAAPSVIGRRHTSASALPTVVLVHGAWADASSWDGVVSSLRRWGYSVVAAANPLEGLDQDSAALASLLRSIDGPIVLVGHSYGGAVISNAAAGNPNVKALVYIAGFAPDNGESIGQLISQPVQHPIASLPLLTYSVTNADGSTATDAYIDPARFRQVFAGDVGSRLAADMAATQRPVNTEAISETTKNAAWHTIPSWYLVAKQDHAIAPDLERYMADRIHAHTIEVDGSHSVMVSHPVTVAHLIQSADRGTR